MSSQKRYEILPSLPAYGPMHISITHNGFPFYSEGFVVRFYKDDGSDWVANFQPGWGTLDRVIEFNNSSNLLVIAFGTCYLMDPNDITPIEDFGLQYSKIFNASKGRLILQDVTDFTIIEPDGTYWNTPRISWDGLKDVKVEDNVVSGLAFTPVDTPEWVEFSYDIDTKILTGGSYKNFS
jgi:hypothetical protein